MCVLTKAEIMSLAEQRELISEGYDRDQVQPASYDFRLGKEYFQKGTTRVLRERDSVKMEPSEVVFVESLEVFKLPPNIVATFDLRMGYVYAGLMLQPGAQIDPGYRGRVFMLLFNLSDQPIELPFGDHVATMVFCYTRQVTETLVSDRQDKMSLEEVLPPNLAIRSGLAGVAEQLEKLGTGLESKTQAADRAVEKADSMSNIMFLFMTVIVGVLALIVTPGRIAEVKQFGPTWEASLIVGSIALAMTLIVGFFFWRIATSSRQVATSSAAPHASPDAKRP
jgi:deoxycytidine triphosphate deaminase